MSTIGYVTADEADIYIGLHYASLNADRVRWEALDDADKDIYLLQSVEAIDALPFQGRKYQTTEESQALAFPRVFKCPYGYYHNCLDFGCNYECGYEYLSATPTVPTVVKYAQIENALKLSAEIDISQYDEMRLQGVTSYTIGNLSESLKDLGSSGMTYTDIVSYRALKLLKSYLMGGYSI